MPIPFVGTFADTVTVKMETTPVEFKIYPNPTNGILSIEAPNNNNNVIDKVVVVDLLGKIILEEIPVHNEINLERFTKGTYILQIYYGEETFVTKVIKI